MTTRNVASHAPSKPSFWLVDALARDGLVRDATSLMEELVTMSNDAGLYAEKIDARTGLPLLLTLDSAATA